MLMIDLLVFVQINSKLKNELWNHRLRRRPKQWDGQQLDDEAVSFAEQAGAPGSTRPIASSLHGQDARQPEHVHSRQHHAVLAESSVFER